MAYPDNHENGLKNWICSRTGIATFVALSVLGFLVYEGHGAHLLGLLPYLLILSCPLMHVFMHGGHHHHDGKDDDKHNGGKR